THTSAKCRKHNSPVSHRTSRVQYDLTLRDAIARRYFYVWRDRCSFRTAKTLSRHWPSLNPAAQQSLPLLCCRQKNQAGEHASSATATAHHAARPRGGRLAAGGVRTAAGEASDWFS